MTKTDDTHVTWRTASRSGGGNCVEVGWRISTHSHTGETCVEAYPGAVVRVRDTKDRDRGGFGVSAPAWARFLTGVC